LQRAARLDRERSRFLADLSHELRTPLNAIFGFAHLLESEADGPLDDESVEAVGVIRTSGHHLKCLVDDILDLSAMETGQLRLTRAVVDARAIGEEVMKEARAMVGNKPLTLQVEGADTCTAFADPRRLRQVLTNLVSNAIDATIEGSVRMVFGPGARNTVSIKVIDTGRGIASDALASIFEPYQQGKAPKQRGVGLGLAIARRLVLLHEGTIEVSSAPNQGTSFLIHLPDVSQADTLPRNSLVPWTDSAETSHHPSNPPAEPSKENVDD
jgi:signal transduction histidine kinase